MTTAIRQPSDLTGPGMYTSKTYTSTMAMTTIRVDAEVRDRLAARASRSLTSASTRIVVIAMVEVYVFDVYMPGPVRSEGWRIAVVITTVCHLTQTFEGGAGLSNEIVKWHLFAHMTIAD